MKVFMISLNLLNQIALMITFLFINCARKPQSQKPKQLLVEDRTTDPLYDKTQQTVELQEDPLANVRLLTPTLPGGCNDENAAKEAANRHKTNAYFPELEIQTMRIVDSTKDDVLREMIDRLPPHLPQQYRKGLKEPSLEERYAKWKDFHVNWHEKGLVFLIRSSDPCRAKDDSPGDTVDSPYPDDDDDEEKLNSEMPISEHCDNRPGTNAPSRGRSTLRSRTKSEAVIAKSTKTKSSKTKSSKKSKRNVSLDEKKLERTQQETALPTLTPLTPDCPKSEPCE